LAQHQLNTIKLASAHFHWQSFLFRHTPSIIVSQRRS